MTLFTVLGNVYILKHICRRLTLISNIGCDLNPLYLLLGVADKNIKSISNRKLFNLLTYAAHKSILLEWINRRQHQWHKVIFDFLSLEYVTYWSKGKMDAFYQIWTTF